MQMKLSFEETAGKMLLKLFVKTSSALKKRQKAPDLGIFFNHLAVKFLNVSKLGDGVRLR